MSRKDPNKRRKRREKHINRRRDFLKDRCKWPSESPMNLGMLLELSAPAIEAAGSIQRALRLGVMGCDEETAKQLEQFVPVSRGGRVKHPDVDRDWMEIVDKAVKDRGIDLEEMREHLRNLPDPN